MSDMYKIVRYVPQDQGGIFGGGINGARKYHGFEKAKQGMRETVKNKYAGMEKHCADLIDAYCQEYYPNSVPHNFKLLKQLISDYFNKPDELELELENKYADIDFEDERVHFALSFDFTPEGLNRFLYIEVADEAKWKFPEGCITSIQMNELTDPESERYVLLTAGKNYGIEVVLSLMTDEDEDSLPWEDWD